MKSDALRVLMVAPTAVAGGMEDIFFNLATTLPAFGVTADVVSLQTGPLVERFTQRKLPVEVIDAGRLRDAKRFWETSRRVDAALRNRPVHVVFANMPKAHLYTALPALRRQIPALWCQAGYPDPAHWTDKLASALPGAGVVALSRDAAAAQERLSERHPVHMMHPGIDLARFRVRSDIELRRRVGIPPDATLVSLVGRLQPWKGQREFLYAAAGLVSAHRNAYFAIVGGAILGWEGDYPQELQRLVLELGIEDRVTFTGHTTEVPRWMAASDVVVNASDPEPFGLVVLEAMASGCAVVAVEKGGPRDIVEPGRNGLLCASREPAALGPAMRRLIEDPGLRDELGQAARIRVERAFTREKMTARFVTILERTARRR